MISAMMKTPAPMTGGMMAPPVPAAVAIAAASCGRKPARFIIGIVIAPVVTARVGDDDPWWSPRRPADFGGRPRARPGAIVAARSAAFDAPWTSERIAIDRAHLLRRLGRYPDAAEAWDALACGPGRTAILASIELAKIHEHRLRDPASALAATMRGLGHVERRRRLGRPEPALETDLRRRLDRLRRRIRADGGGTSAPRSDAVA